MAVVAAVLIVTTLTVLAVVSWWFSVSGKLYRLDVPIAGGASLILGHTWAGGKGGLYSEGGVKWFSKWGNIYPKLFRLRLGTLNVLCTSHPQYVRALFKEKPEKNWLYSFYTDWLGDGILFSKSDKWFARRKLLTPSFHFQILKSYIDIFNDTTNIMVGQLRESGGKPVEMFPKALSLTLDTILKTLLHYDSKCHTQYDEYADIMYKLSAIAIDRLYNPLKHVDKIYLMTGQGKKYAALKERFLEVTMKIVNDRKEEHRRNPGILDDVKKLSFLDVLLTVKYEDGSSLTMEDIIQEANVFIFAGHDTTASAISWSLFQLSQHPQHMEKCYQEIRTVFDEGDKDEYVTQNQINNLPYFSVCIKECLRLKSPTPYIGRNLHKDCEIDGIRIPKGANVFVLIDVLHRLEEYWEDPLVFRPERFSAEASKDRDPYSYIPFSVGNRNCIGQNFAVTELKIAVAKAIYNFNVTAYKPENVTRLFAGIQKPLDMFLKFQLRSDQ